MIWNLLLAHFVGDFLLQTDWIARKKENNAILALHVTILFFLMILFAGNYRNVLWPYLTLIATSHFIQDRLKMFLTHKKQQQRVLFFFIDQFVHILIIVAVVSYYESFHGPIVLTGSPTWAVIALVAVLLTQVWFITERVIFADDKEYVEAINQSKFSRMIIRAGLTGFFTLARTWAFSSQVLFVFAPYPKSEHQKRAIIIDMIVSIIGFLIIILALG